MKHNANSVKAALSLPLMVLILFGAYLALTPTPAHASSSLSQLKVGGCTTCGSSGTATAAFAAAVAVGDVIVVGVSANGGTVNTPTDTLSATYSEQVTSCDFSDCSYIYTATIASAGSDTVSVGYSGSPQNVDVYAYDISGATTTGLTTGTGHGGSSSYSTSAVSFSPGAFLMAELQFVLGPPTAGTGFTLATQTSGSGKGYSEYATSGITSPTTFPLTSGINQIWGESSIQIPAAPVSVPEFPLQLAVPVLFTLGVAIYMGIRRGLNPIPSGTGR